MFYVTVGVIIILLVISGFLLLFGEILGEYGTPFLYLIGILFVVIIGAGVYLGFAVPSFAGGNLLSKSPSAQATITQDSPVGFPSEEK
jgi:hypothetical protein